MITRRPAVQHQIGPETPVTICQLESEFDRVMRLYHAVSPMRVLELGTASGGSLYHWIIQAPEGANVVSVDLPNPDYPLDRAECKSWADAANINLFLIEGDTHDPRTASEVAQYGPFDWIFIDANHRYEHVAADLRDYWPMLTDTGYLLLHDIALKRFYEDGDEAGVSKAWREIQSAGYWTAELRAQPLVNEYGIGIIRGKEPAVPITTEDLPDRPPSEDDE